MTTTSAPAQVPRIRPGSRPLAPAAASYLSVAAALILIALGALGVRDTLVAVGWVDGAPWIADALGAADAVAPAWWTAAAGMVAAVFGLLLITLALTPRRRTAVEAGAHSAVYVGLTDVARIAAAAAEGVAGVVSARSTASLRKVTVRCEVAGAGDPELTGLVTRAVTTELAALQRSPRITVRMDERART